MSISKYKPDYCRKVVQLSIEGNSMRTIAKVLGVTKKALANWAKRHPAFGKAYMEGKSHFADYLGDLSIGEACTGNLKFHIPYYNLVCLNAPVDATKHTANKKLADLERKLGIQVDITKLSIRGRMLLCQRKLDSPVDVKPCPFSKELAARERQLGIDVDVTKLTMQERITLCNKAAEEQEESA